MYLYTTSVHSLEYALHSRAACRIDYPIRTRFHFSRPHPPCLWARRAAEERSRPLIAERAGGRETRRTCEMVEHAAWSWTAETCRCCYALQFVWGTRIIHHRRPKPAELSAERVSGGPRGWDGRWAWVWGGLETSFWSIWGSIGFLSNAMRGWSKRKNDNDKSCRFAVHAHVMSCHVMYCPVLCRIFAVYVAVGD